jgi:phytanoyl-CoA hydroxylase
MVVLAGEQRNIFQDQGFILLENAIDTLLLEGLQNDFNGWIKDSINHQQPYGEMLDGRPSFEPETCHSKEQPALRRVASPTEISAICLKVVC